MTHSATLTRLPARPLGVSVAGLAIIPVRAGLWRVASSTGSILGHIEERSSGTAQQPRFSARLLRADGVHFMPLGEFWRAEDAVECFR